LSARTGLTSAPLFDLSLRASSSHHGPWADQANNIQITVARRATNQTSERQNSQSSRVMKLGVAPPDALPLLVRNADGTACLD
jgi:hypothetical protein